MQALREAFGPRAQMLRAWPINFLICALKLLILPRIALRSLAILLAAALTRSLVNVDTIFIVLVDVSRGPSRCQGRSQVCTISSSGSNARPV